MKKSAIAAILLLAGATIGFSACSGKEKKSAADTVEAETATEEVAVAESEVATDSIAERFRNPKYETEYATDSTYARTPSGLKYMIKKEGKGAMPGPTDQVTVNYAGHLLDGTIFDSSYERREPATFPLNGVIAGWTEGLQLMKEGSVYWFYIPTDLAYGAHGAPGAIPPYADLIFEVELIKVN